MKKTYSLILLIVSLFMIGGCNAKEETATFDSYLLSDILFGDELKSLDAKFAVEITKSNNIYTQTFFIWNNELRRALRADLILLASKLDFENNRVSSYKTSITKSNESVNIIISMNRKELKSYTESELSTLIIAALLPQSFYSNQNEFLLALFVMIARLETLEEFGDTEVVCLEVKTNESLILSQIDLESLYSLNDFADMIDLMNIE
jgi:hypothetical protein